MVKRMLPSRSKPLNKAANPKSGRVLVAEDLEITTKIARAILESAGHTVDVVADGAAAIRSVSTQHYDLILMDVHMPVMDGISATRRIRSLSGAQSRVPIVAMTAMTSVEDRSILLGAGMSGHLGKPFRKSELLAAIEPWLS